jgi:hypothetical protein
MKRDLKPRALVRGGTEVRRIKRGCGQGSGRSGRKDRVRVLEREEMRQEKRKRCGARRETWEHAYMRHEREEGQHVRVGGSDLIYKAVLHYSGCSKYSDL